MENRTSDITIIIVTFNSARTIKSCIDSIIKYCKWCNIIIVDNSSSDETLQILDTYKDKITVHKLPQNFGFSKANNIGAGIAKGQYLVFLNPDTRILESDCLVKLKSELEENNNYLLIGPQLIYPDKKIQKTVRNLPGVINAFEEYILKSKGSYDFYLPKSESICTVESIVGACMMIRKDKFQEINGFDEKYFLYFEDLDICHRVKNVGFLVGYVPSIKIEHFEGASNGGVRTLSFLHSSAKLYHGLLRYFLIQAIIRIGQKIWGIR